MKIINGIYKLDDGEIWYKGEKIIPKSPKAMLDMGIATIHQELSPLPNMTIAENIFLGREPLGFPEDGGLEKNVGRYTETDG